MIQENWLRDDCCLVAIHIPIAVPAFSPTASSGYWTIVVVIAITIAIAIAIAIAIDVSVSVVIVIVVVVVVQSCVIYLGPDILIVVIVVFVDVVVERTIVVVVVIVVVIVVVDVVVKRTIRTSRVERNTSCKILIVLCTERRIKLWCAIVFVFV